MPIFRPIWPPSGSKTCLPSKINPNFLWFFHTFLRKRARRGQLRRVISQQPCKVEKKVSPFWKVDKQGFNIRLNPRKSIIWPWTPPPIALSSPGESTPWLWLRWWLPEWNLKSRNHRVYRVWSDPGKKLARQSRIVDIYDMYLSILTTQWPEICIAVIYQMRILSDFPLQISVSARVGLNFDPSNIGDGITFISSV